MRTEYERIRRILEQQFQAALKRRDIAAAKFREANKDIPSGLPHPDGTQRIINASRDFSLALEEVRRAVQRIAEFEGRGLVPDDLKSNALD